MYALYANGGRWEGGKWVNGKWVLAPHIALMDRAVVDAVHGRGPKRIIVAMPPRHGKLIAHDCLVPTPGGMKTHGELSVGDWVYHPSGKQIRVIATMPESPCDCRITFTNGATVDCHENHEWTVYDRSRGETKTVETSYIEGRKLHSGPVGKRGGRYVLQLPIVSPLQNAVSNLIIDPYVLGVWLGDGSSAKPSVTYHPDDCEIVSTFESRGYLQSSTAVHKDTGVLTTTFGGDLQERSRNEFDGDRGTISRSRLWMEMKELGLVKNKHIPEAFLFADELSRRELLAGLIDSDETVGRDNRTHFVNCNKRLIDDVAFLIRSLGYRATITSQDPTVSSSGIVGRQVVYTVSFSVHDGIHPAKLKRKRIGSNASVRRRIGVVSVERIKPKLGKCIQVDSDDGLYLVTDQLIPTHNSEYISRHVPPWFIGNYPDKSVILASYEADFAASHGKACRDLMDRTGDWFGVKLDNSSKSASRWNIAGRRGGMATAGAGGPITGKGAHLLIVDDIIKNAEEASSKTIRDKHVDWWKSTAYTRIEPGGVAIIVMTRWHESDLAGYLIEDMKDGGEEWLVINFPAICELESDELGRKKGDPLWPERYSLEDLNKIERTLGPRWWAALYQQRPAPLEGGLFKRDWLPKKEVPTSFKRTVRAWDLAGTEGDGDWTAGVLLAYDRLGKFYVVDVVRGQWGPSRRDEIIHATAKKDGSATQVVIEQEPGSAGKAVVEYIKKKLKGYSVKAFKPTGPKEIRAEPFASQCGAGTVTVATADWNYDFIEELCMFPNGTHDDQVDAAAMAFQQLSGATGGLWSGA